MRKLTLLSCLFFLTARSLYGTGDSLNYLTLEDTIFLKRGLFDEKIFEHKMEPKQTLYSLAKFYGLSLGEVYLYNPALKELGYKVGDFVKIPIPNRAISRYKNEDYSPDQYIPVYYVIKKGDTMYGLSKRLFKMPMDTLFHRNEALRNGLKQGQQIHVGWMNIVGIPESYRLYSGGYLGKINHKYRQKFNADAQSKKLIEHQGVAEWKKDSRENNDLYALHPYAKKHSIIAITNPMKRRTVYVKVVGKVPETVYGPEVKTVISPFVAKLLGAKDPKFFVKIKYLTR